MEDRLEINPGVERKTLTHSLDELTKVVDDIRGKVLGIPSTEESAKEPQEAIQDVIQGSRIRIERNVRTLHRILEAVRGF